MSRSPLGRGPTRADVTLMLEAHEAVLPILRSADESMSAAVDLIVRHLSRGGRLFYVGAGTSGWLAALDAAEVVVTFGMTDRVVSVIGGGHLLDPVAMTLGDDAVETVADDPTLEGCGEADVVIAVSASGSTPFTLAAVDRARAGGAQIVAIVNREGSQLASMADVTILVRVEDEVVAGSTRLGAGLAQKVVLNTLSTVSMIRLGRTVDGQMVCVEALNDKLRRRLVGALATAAHVDEDSARAALAEAGRGDIAVVSLLAGIDVDEARARLASTHGNIAAAASMG